MNGLLNALAVFPAVDVVLVLKRRVKRNIQVPIIINLLIEINKEVDFSRYDPLCASRLKKSYGTLIFALPSFSSLILFRVKAMERLMIQNQNQKAQFLRKP